MIYKRGGGGDWSHGANPTKGQSTAANSRRGLKNGGVASQKIKSIKAEGKSYWSHRKKAKRYLKSL